MKKLDEGDINIEKDQLSNLFGSLVLWIVKTIDPIFSIKKIE